MTNVATEAPEIHGERHDVLEHAKRVAKALSPKDVQTVTRLRAQGVAQPARVLLAAKQAKLQPSLAGALVLEQHGLLQGGNLVAQFSRMSVFVRRQGQAGGIAAYAHGQTDPAGFAQRVE